MKLEDLLQLLDSPKQSGKEWVARCPAHDDSKASLSVTESDDGSRILLKCFAGCETTAIVQALGIKMHDLFTKSKPAILEQSENNRVVAEYGYTDAGGSLLYQVVRYEPKDFRQRQPDGKGGWSWNMKGVKRVLYRLVQVNSAIAAGMPVFIVEGEKDVHSLESIGLTATTNAGGAAKWEARFSDSLQGADVIILPDNDGPGRKHAELVANALCGIAKSVRVLELPGLSEKGDVSDWLAAGGTEEDLLSLVEAASEWIPTAAEQCEHAEIPGSASDGYPLTDLGNAERLIACHGKDLRYHVEAGVWLVWNGKQWVSDCTGQVDLLARGVVRGMYDLLKECRTTAESEALFRHIRSSESKSKLDAMVTLATKCEGIPVQSCDLDSDNWLLNCENGTVDLRTEKLRPHRPEDLLTKLSPVVYDTAAKCERWERFLREVFPGGEENHESADEELAGFVRRMCGYLLTGDTGEQCFFLLTGKGSNGKSVLVNTLIHILGDYAKGTPVTTFLEKRGENSSDLASLVGARIVTASESEGTTSFNESLLKQLTGQDGITARHLYQNYFTFKPTFRVIFATNEVPRIKSQNYAIKRRVKLLPFRTKFYYPHEQKFPVRDERLTDTLKAEASGILAWCIRGCGEWQKEGLGMPDVIQAEVDSLFENMDVLLDFIEEECEIHPRYRVETGELWKAYQAWCEASKTKPVFKRASDFSRNLTGRDNIENTRGGKGIRYITGIGLLGGESRSKVTPGDAKTAFSGTLPYEHNPKHFPENANSRHPASPYEENGEEDSGVVDDSKPKYDPVKGECSHCGKTCNFKAGGEYACPTCITRYTPSTEGNGRI